MSSGDAALRRALTEALAEKVQRDAPRNGVWPPPLCDLAEALLPTVLAFAEEQGRRRAAEELRAAADEIDGDGLGGLSGAYRRMYSSDLLRARAAALAPENARPE